MMGHGRLATRVVLLGAGVLTAAGIAVALPATATLAGSSACSTTSGADKCVAITSVSSQTLQVGAATDVTYTFQPNAGAPQVLGSLELSPADGSGITFAGVSSSLAAANCSISAAGAAVCLDLDASPGQSFGVTIDVEVSCTAAGGNFSLLLSGASDFRNDPNGRGDAFAADLPSTDGTMSYLQQNTAGSCAPAPPTIDSANIPWCDPTFDPAVIDGTNFVDVTAVSINGIPTTTFVVNSPTELTITYSNDAVGIESVTVTTAGGTVEADTPFSCI